MIERFRREPALVYSLLEAIIVLAVAFGLDLSAQQTGAILAVLAVLTGVGVRSQVTPVRAPSLDDDHADAA